MKRFVHYPFFLLLACVAQLSQTAHAQASSDANFRDHFLQVCDRAVAQVTNAHSKGSFFVDSYGVRALCAASDMTGKPQYLSACRQWCDRILHDQERMSPPGAYYMHYNRKPGETNGDWYAADSSSIGMAILATSVRCKGSERQRYLNSVKQFADLVLANYVKPSGGVTDGLWARSHDEWWCSTGLYASLSFLLYKTTDEAKYLAAGLGAVDWLNQWDPKKDQPFPLSQQGPAMIMYVMECYSAGWPYIAKDVLRKPGAVAKISWCLDWMLEQQKKPLMDRAWPPTKGWGMKFGGLPFHEYLFSRYWGNNDKLVPSGDAEMSRLAGMVFAGKPQLTQLPMFMLMSYGERLNPGAIYKSE